MKQEPPRTRLSRSGIPVVHGGEDVNEPWKTNPAVAWLELVFESKLAELDARRRYGDQFYQTSGFIKQSFEEILNEVRVERGLPPIDAEEVA